MKYLNFFSLKKRKNQHCPLLRKYRKRKGKKLQKTHPPKRVERKVRIVTLGSSVDLACFMQLRNILQLSDFCLLCRLRSIGTHRDHFVRRLSVRPSVCPSVTLPELSFAGDACIPRNAATIFFSLGILVFFI